MPGTIQITEDTLRAIAGQFEVEPLGGVEVLSLIHISEPTRPY